MKVSFCQEELELTLEQEFKFAQYRAEINQITNRIKVTEHIHEVAKLIKIKEEFLFKILNFSVPNESNVFKLNTEKALASVIKMTLEGKKQFLLSQLEYTFWLDQKQLLSMKIK